MNFADTTTLADIQIARAEQAPGWEAGDTDLASARAEHQPAEPTYRELAARRTRLTEDIAYFAVAREQACDDGDQSKADAAYALFREAMGERTAIDLQIQEASE